MNGLYFSEVNENNIEAHCCVIKIEKDNTVKLKGFISERDKIRMLEAIISSIKPSDRIEAISTSYAHVLFHNHTK